MQSKKITNVHDLLVDMGIDDDIVKSIDKKIEEKESSPEWKIIKLLSKKIDDLESKLHWKSTFVVEPKSTDSDENGCVMARRQVNERSDVPVFRTSYVHWKEVCYKPNGYLQWHALDFLK